MLKLSCLLLILPLALCGCSPRSGIENRAYAVALGLDGDEGGRLTLSVSVPRIGKPSGDEAKGGGDYLHFSASGKGWPEALAALRQAVPRALNLSHIALLAVSDALAASDRFPALINQLAETRNLYTATRVVVCPDRAEDFIRGDAPLLGTRLSAEVDGAMFHYAALGAIPDTCLADLYCASNSVYGDIAVAAGRALPEDDAAEAAALISPSPAGARSTPANCEYAGCALFSAGQMRLRLDARDTRCLNLVTGGLCLARAEAGGQAVELTVAGPVRRHMAVRGGAAALSVRLDLRAREPLNEAEAREVELEIAGEVTRVIHACQREGLDPFGFAEDASRRFFTLHAWHGFDWRASYASAPLTVHVSVRAG